MSRRFGGRFGGNSSEAYQRQLSAPVHKWKKAWVSPSGLQPESSYKICKWVRVDAAIEDGSPAPDEDEDMEDGEEGDEVEIDGEDGVGIAEAEAEAGDGAKISEDVEGGEDMNEHAVEPAHTVGPTAIAAKGNFTPVAMPAADEPAPAVLLNSPITPTLSAAPTTDSTTDAVRPHADSPPQPPAPSPAAPTPTASTAAAEPAAPVTHALPANAIEIHNTAPHTTEMGAGDLAGLGGVEMTHGEAKSAVEVGADSLGMEVEQPIGGGAGADQEGTADVGDAQAPEVDEGLVMGDVEPVREEFVIEGEDKPREVDV